VISVGAMPSPTAKAHAVSTQTFVAAKKITGSRPKISACTRNRSATGLDQARAP
jgi:hypothetical protein